MNNDQQKLIPGKSPDAWANELARSRSETRRSFERLRSAILHRRGWSASMQELGRTTVSAAHALRCSLALRTLRRRARRAERRDERRAARELRKYRHRMRKTIFGTTLRRAIIFTVLYWGIFFIILNTPDIYYAVRDFVWYNMNLSLNTDLASWMVILNYAIIMLVWPMSVLRRTAGYIDSISLAADNLLDRNHDLPKLPSVINELDVKLRGIRLSVIQSEHAAREAEQRKNDLVVYLAHDLKTPLSSVIGYLTLLEELPDLPTEQRAKYTSITLDKAYRLEQLINEFFEITRFNLQSVELANNRIDLSLMLRQIADEFYPVLEEKGLSVRLETEPRLLMTGDADKLMRVFDNLLRNAVSYSYEDTQIVIEAYMQDENTVSVSISNTGDEIPPRTLTRLFEKFFRADSARTSSTGGAGLGLAIAKNIVELHGGSISADSNPICTKFTLTLPIVRNS